MDHDPENSKCFLDGLFSAQRKHKEVENPLSDRDIYGITADLIFAGTYTLYYFCVCSKSREKFLNLNFTVNPLLIVT